MGLLVLAEAVELVVVEMDQVVILDLHLVVMLGQITLEEVEVELRMVELVELVDLE